MVSIGYEERCFCSGHHSSFRYNRLWEESSHEDTALTRVLPLLTNQDDPYAYRWPGSLAESVHANRQACSAPPERCSHERADHVDAGSALGALRTLERRTTLAHLSRSTPDPTVKLFDARGLVCLKRIPAPRIVGLRLLTILGKIPEIEPIGEGCVRLEGVALSPVLEGKDGFPNDMLCVLLPHSPDIGWRSPATPCWGWPKGSRQSAPPIVYGHLCRSAMPSPQGLSSLHYRNNPTSVFRINLMSKRNDDCLTYSLASLIFSGKTCLT